ncbi:MAG TPA: hypothetical protein VGC39_07850 [Candidatus Methylacidiphilales bacterium]
MENQSTPPSAGIPNDAWGIQLTITREEREDVPRLAVRETVTIKQLLDRYTVTLGYRNSHLQEVLVTLMTTGKVVVEFRSHTDRLQLRDFGRIMTRPATIELFNEYLVNSKEQKISGPEVTKRITVQLPKIVPVTPRNTPPLRAPPVP